MYFRSCISLTSEQAFKFRFGAHPHLLKPELAASFILNKVDDEMAAFFDNCEWSVCGAAKHYIDSLGKTVLSPFISKTAVNGLLNRGRMFVLSSDQFRNHLAHTFPDRELPRLPMHSLLDIGS